MPSNPRHISEIKTLAALCAPVADSEAARRAAENLQPSDWRRALALARLNRCSAPLAKNLLRHNLACLAPSDIHLTIENIPRAAAARNMLILDSARAITSAAYESGVDMIPLKGVSYIDLFCAPDERNLLDADFLVRREQLAALEAMMSDLGWTRAESPLPEIFVIEYSGEIKYTSVRAGTRVDVETQWDPSHSLMSSTAYHLHADTLWGLSRRENGTLSLAPEAVVLYHIFHMAAVHSFSRLQWLLDIAPMCDALKPDWDALARLLRASGLESAAAHAFSLSEELFGSPSPPRSAIPAPAPTPLNRAIRDLIYKSLSGDIAVKRSGAISLLLAERRAAPLFSLVFPPAKYLAFRYPSVPAPLRHPYRAAKLFSKLFTD